MPRQQLVAKDSVLNHLWDDVCNIICYSNEYIFLPLQHELPGTTAYPNTENTMWSGK